MDSMTENVMEFLRGQQRATLTFSQGRFISRVRKLAEERPEDCQITAENADGSIVAHVPVSWIKINPPRELTEGRKQSSFAALEKAWKARGIMPQPIVKRSNPAENPKDDKEPV